jgi:multidrug efflux system membrane fusion protein
MPSDSIRGTVRSFTLIVLVAVAAAGCDAASDSGRNAGGPGRSPEFPVEVETARSGSVEYEVAAVGSVDAFERVRVVARVPGAVERVRFSEGQRVERDQVLVEIEPERYRVEVESARAALRKAEAELDEALAGLARREREPGLFPTEDIDLWRRRARVGEADVESQRAVLARAELNLRDALVRAPVGGTIETRSVETGQYVQPGAVLASLVRREPLLVRFDVTEPDAGSLQAGMTVRFSVPGDDHSYAATITHVGGSADAASRMVAVTGQVTDAAREALRPGSFAEVRVPVARTEGAPVVPETAIRPSERGFLAFVVEDGVARERVLDLGLRTADGRIEIRSGLAPGEPIVVRGAEALSDGARVRVEPAGAAAGSAK